MKKSVFLSATITLLVCLTLVGCQTPAEPEKNAPVVNTIDGQARPPVSSAPEGYPENPTGNIWSPGREELVPYYEVPAGWEVNPSSRWYLRNSAPGQENSYLTLEHAENQDSPQAARDAAYEKTVCQNGENQNTFIDCQKAPGKSESQMAGQQVYQLTYRGTWRGKEEKVQLFFFQNGAAVYSARIEGPTTGSPAVVEKIISTLNFKLEVFTPQNNPEDLGGI